MLLLFYVIMVFDFKYFGNKKNSQHFSVPFFNDNSFADNAGVTVLAIFSTNYFQIGQHVVLLHIQIRVN